MKQLVEVRLPNDGSETLTAQVGTAAISAEQASCALAAVASAKIAAGKRFFIMERADLTTDLCCFKRGSDWMMAFDEKSTHKQLYRMAGDGMYDPSLCF